jgi:hypothetical protein
MVWIRQVRSLVRLLQVFATCTCIAVTDALDYSCLQLALFVFSLRFYEPPSLEQVFLSPPVETPVRRAVGFV